MTDKGIRPDESGIDYVRRLEAEIEHRKNNCYCYKCWGKGYQAGLRDARKGVLPDENQEGT